jgi:hypothetical protein
MGDTSVGSLLVLIDEEVAMSWDNMNQELSYQRIAELHADAERVRQVRVSKRRRQSRGRRWHLGRLLKPTTVASRANDVLGGIISPPWASREETPGPSRP